MNKNNSKNENDCREQKPFFKGCPYLMIVIKDWFFHINLLSKQNNPEDLFRLAQAQTDANKLGVFLVLNENKGVYFLPESKPRFSEQIPKGRGHFITGQLLLSTEQPADVDLLLREKELKDFIQRNRTSGYIVGDLSKGGRKATHEELICLQGFQENGLPKGLVICMVCGDYKGECLDLNKIMDDFLIVRVSCYCENDNLCAYCGGQLNKRKANANRYNPEDGKIWHAPSFSVLSDYHQCSYSTVKDSLEKNRQSVRPS
jgi:hypothetical protein